LGRGISGLPKLLDFNEAERWIVTEYFPERTLEHHPHKYRGKVGPALEAFRSLVQTVAMLHREAYVHRDIKPANVFIRNDDELVLGDFGIVFLPNALDRVTQTGERVGPRDYMPPWANLGTRHEKVHPKDDVYMLASFCGR
jgi:serine/threonine protein kinase